jgi:hypothetical protein
VSGQRKTFPPVARSVPDARRFVCDALTGLGAPGACDDAEALVSELATNAVLHAHTEFSVHVTCSDGTVQIRVHDLSAVLPRTRHYGLDSTTGRGVRLIASMASDWGVDREGSGGKSVWFELPSDGTSAVDGDVHDGEVDVEAFLAAYDDDGPNGGAPSAYAMAA